AARHPDSARPGHGHRGPADRVHRRARAGSRDLPDQGPPGGRRRGLHQGVERMSVGTVGTVAAPDVSSRRAVTMGVLFLGAGAILAVGFGLTATSGVDSTFVLNPPRGVAVHVGDLTLSTRVTELVLAAICAALGLVQLS